MKDFRILTICFLSFFFGFLRFNEVSKLKRCNISFKSGHVDLFLERAKTDCCRQGNHVFIARLDSPRCPVKLLSEYLELAKIEPFSDVFVFRALISVNVLIRLF